MTIKTLVTGSIILISICIFILYKIRSLTNNKQSTNEIIDEDGGTSSIGGGSSDNSGDLGLR